MPDNDKKTIVICDLDGTLIDSRADLAKAVNLTRRSRGLPELDIPTVTSYIGDGARKLVERAFRGTGVDVDSALEEVQIHYRDVMLDATYAYPTVVEGLETLKSHGFKLAIVTNKPHQHVSAILEALGLLGFFDSIRGGSSELPLKPDPAMLFAAAEDCGAKAGDGWIVGDNHTDIASGRAAGTRVCFANYGFGDARGMESDIEIDSFAEFAEFLTGR